MGELLDFEMSSQAKCWMYDTSSLNECREQACDSNNTQQYSTRGTGRGSPRVRKFACGYYNRRKSAATNTANTTTTTDPSSTTISQHDQETLVHFHAHQIQKLIGPNAVFPLLKRGSSVLSTAIMLFKKFYLSNSVIDFHPRNIAAASALLAVKTDCERNIPIDVLSHATLVVEMRAQNDPFCGDELRAVTIEEIEAAERALLEGCDYRLRSHQPYGAIKVLVSDVASFLMESRENNTTITTDYSFDTGSSKSCDDGRTTSPRSVVYEQQQQHDDHDDHHLDTLCERALSVAQTALVYSDINFLFPPGQIAFAAVALALDGHTSSSSSSSSSSSYKNESTTTTTTTCNNRLGENMREYLCARFSQKSSKELSEYEKQVSKIITNLENCPAIDLEMFSPLWQYHQRRYARTAERQAIKIRRAIFTASRLRFMTGAAASAFQFQTTTTTSHTPAFVPTSPQQPPPPSFAYHHQQHQHNHNHHHHYNHPRYYHQDNHYEGEIRRKRVREDENTWTRPHHKIARVTPINTPFI